MCPLDFPCTSDINPATSSSACDDEEAKPYPRRFSGILSPDRLLSGGSDFVSDFALSIA